MDQKEFSKGEVRQDWYDGLNDLTSPLETTEEGFLKARVVVTTVGVFTYKNPDGTARRELRLPEEVFNSDSLATLSMKPLTLLHPDEMVTPDNSDSLQVGSLGDSIYNDSYRVYAPIVVTHKDAIESVRDRKALGLSCGYNCDIEWTSGTWFGQQYDCIQRNIRYNHVALVPRPRAGDDAVIRLDDAGVPGAIPRELTQTKEPNMDLKTVRLDGVDYQAEGPVIASLNKTQEMLSDANKNLDQARKDNADLTTKVSTLEGERDSLKERLDQAEKDAPARIQSAVQAQIELMDKARTAGVEVRADMAPMDIKKAVVLKKFPNANLDGKDAAYIDARFDSACELIASDAENASRRDAADVQNTHTATSDSEKVLADSLARFNKRMDSAWQDQPNKEA